MTTTGQMTIQTTLAIPTATLVEMAEFSPRRKSASFVSFYVLKTDTSQWMPAEHGSEAPAARGSWQSPDMKRLWQYVGYRAA